MDRDPHSLDRRLAELAHLAESEPAPELYLQLGKLYLRADDVERALAAFQEGLRVTRAVVLDLASGQVELDTIREELREEVEEALALQRVRQRVHERRLLVEALEARGLSREEHDRLIRLEAELELPIHGEEARCPACEGPLIDDPSGPEGSVRCARTGEGGDLCRHMDAVNLYACGACGFVLRAWLERRPRKSDPHEPPMVRPERTRCPYCNGRIADWTQHYRRCPQAGPGRFPRCGVCTQRGFHERPIHCPRCTRRVGVTLCAERRRR